MADEELDRRALSAALQELGTVVVTEHTVDELLAQIVVAARSTVRGADGVSATLVRDHEYLTSHATDEVVTELDRLQYSVREGPCIEAVAQGDVVLFSLGSDFDRFPGFARGARERFITSVLSVPMRAEERTIGALTIYSAQPEELGESAVGIAVLFAAQVSALLANAAAYAFSSEQRIHLERALESRDVIGQAKGILMERQGGSADEAFAELRRVSQDRNEKLVDVARGVVAERVGR